MSVSSELICGWVGAALRWGCVAVGVVLTINRALGGRVAVGVGGYSDDFYTGFSELGGFTLSVNVCCGFIICVWGVYLAVFLPFCATMECNMCASMRWRIKCNMGSVSIVNFAMAIVVLGQIAGAVVDYGILRYCVGVMPYNILNALVKLLFSS